MRRYLTTTLPYVNADPHIGNALEFVQADALVRNWRLAGDEVFFNTGTDEHGQKILEAAEKAGKDVHTYVDHYSEEFRKLGDALGLSEHAFIRTTEPRHYEAAKEMWKRCEAAGDIYKKSYTGLYCVGCEAYKTEKDIVEGKCPIHPSLTLQEITEENYFFRFSKYQDALLEYLSREDSIAPDWRREEAIAFVKGGLEDFSISREKARLTWGVPVPGDESQVMYVWFDALTNYISTLGWPADAEGKFAKFWEEGRVMQVAGKDQVRFQSLMWQAMLMSAGVKNTDQVFYHGFINSGGQRMSKSLGNVINPYELVSKYGTEATRYLLLRHVHPFEDSDITWERMDEWYTANLVNGLGNLVARVMKLAEDHLSAPVTLSQEDTFVEAEFTEKMNRFSFHEAMDLIFEHVAKGDEFMTSEEPYKKIKDAATADAARDAIEKLVRHLAKVAAHLVPFMPKTSVSILAAVAANTKPENLFPRLTA
ncbi:MAG: methionine--tRNA ligase [Candidatus Pacebacteria bacterium]|nr:methionine--tRNA ligase [Candidatus Paceibacterota bacterium]MBP9840027.1 methionine--tRNA ligase [Candidatus Paceibacterota bacterium]